ncbi:MAG: hypothetical protein HWN68_00845 [Desulfobacterales bacterium]|nr:hypothetical protein [Desulfobacterales bacterium]
MNVANLPEDMARQDTRNKVTFLRRVINWIANHILSPRMEGTEKWERVKEEGKAIREETRKLSECIR